MPQDGRRSAAIRRRPAAAFGQDQDAADEERERSTRRLRVELRRARTRAPRPVWRRTGRPAVSGLGFGADAGQGESDCGQCERPSEQVCLHRNLASTSSERAGACPGKAMPGAASQMQRAVQCGSQRSYGRTLDHCSGCKMFADSILLDTTTHVITESSRDSNHWSCRQKSLKNGILCIHIRHPRWGLPPIVRPTAKGARAS